MRITSKGQVTIPVEFREKQGLLPDTEVEFEVREDGVLIRRARKPVKETRGRALVRRLAGTGTIQMTTEEILALMRGPRDDA
jgi:AbrB family looped-hinge helix DNA binding protein